jgi:Domain of unknown function (DUF4397)
VITKRAARASKLTLLVVGAFTLAGTTINPGYAANETAVYVVQGLPDKALDVAIDQNPLLTQDVEIAAASGPFEVTPGRHTVTLSQNGETVLRKTFTIKEGSTVDLVPHLRAVSSNPPEVLLYDKYDGVKLTKDRALLVFSHVGAVPPVDVRVNDRVRMGKIANGQSSQMRMPADTYTIAIVPTGKTGPVYVGPHSLAVEGGSIVHLYLVGDRNRETLRLAPQVLTVPTTGTEKPKEVATGTGGLALGQGSLLEMDLVR